MADAPLSELKVCTKCDLAKPLAEFHRSPSTKCGYVARCKPCQNAFIAGIKARSPEKARQWYRDNKERADERRRQRWALCPDQERARAARYREANREKIREGLRDWARRNPDKAKDARRASDLSRKARKRAARGKFSAQDLKKLKVAQRGRCWWCQEPYGRYHLDHRIPLARGGSNDPSNIVISCARCNQRKSAKLPWQIDNPRLL